MKIELTNIGKQFGRTWIFKEINHSFQAGRPCAVIGANGSGKSTFLKIISGGLTPTLGALRFIDHNEKECYWSDVAQLVNYAAPYMDLVEYLTLEEHVNFHFKFKHYAKGWDKSKFIAAIEMEKHKNKLIRDFSSGMKQRLKLAFSLFTENPILLLDEPTANLDHAWSSWYVEHVSQLVAHKTIVVASNEPKEYEFCKEILTIADNRD